MFGRICGWAYTRRVKCVSESGGQTRGWNYTRMGLYVWVTRIRGLYLRVRRLYVIHIRGLNVWLRRMGLYHTL